MSAVFKFFPYLIGFGDGISAVAGIVEKAIISGGRSARVR